MKRQRSDSIDNNEHGTEFVSLIAASAPVPRGNVPPRLERIYVSMEISKKLKCRFDRALYHRNSSKANSFPLEIIPRDFMLLRTDSREVISRRLKTFQGQNYRDNETSLRTGELGLSKSRQRSGNL